MYVSQKDFLVRQEQIQDLMRQAERERLVGGIKAPSGTSKGLLQTIADWLGAPRADATPEPGATALTPAHGK
jgi:hypothetical protein